LPSLYLLYRLDGRTVVPELLKLEIKVIQTGNKRHFRRVAFNDNELLAEDAFYDKSAAVMLQSRLTKHLLKADILFRLKLYLWILGSVVVGRPILFFVVVISLVV
jgi:hypothetical protein